MFELHKLLLAICLNMETTCPSLGAEKRKAEKDENWTKQQQKMLFYLTNCFVITNYYFQKCLFWDLVKLPAFCYHTIYLQSSMHKTVSDLGLCCFIFFRTWQDISEILGIPR